MPKAVLNITPYMEQMVREAAERGMERDQIETFLQAGQIVLPSMMEFHRLAREADNPNGPEEIALAGSRGPGKTYTTMQQVGLDDCQRVSGLKFLFLRKIMKTAAESLDDLVRKIFAYTPHRQTKNGVELPNGSRVVIGGYKDVRDIDKYLGIEYDGAVIEEATQLPEDRMEKIRGSVRTSRSDWRPRKYLTSNADGPGLAWFKKTYVIPYRNGTEGITRFIPCNYKDNPFLNPEYVRWLNGLKGSLGKAWRDADWDAFAGMAFPTFVYDKHVIEPFDIPDNWVKWRAVDEGTAAPFCCLWGAKDPNSRRVYVYREAYKAGLTLVHQARMISDMSLEDVMFTYGDPAMWQKRNMDARTYTAADQYKDEGVPLIKADNDRIQGKRKIDTLLEDLPDGKPGIQIFNTCTNLAEQLGDLARDEYNPEDVDTSQEDHAYDTLRYLLSNERRIIKPPPINKTHPLAKVRGI